MPRKITSVVPAHVAGAFGVSPEGVLLPGGEERTFRCADLVLRRESKNAPEIPDALFTAELFSRIPESAEFRIPRPRRARDGNWLHDGWSCWTFVEGRWATAAEAPVLVRAVEAFHRAIADEPCPEYLRARSLVYDRADRGAFGEIPPDVDDRVRPTLIELYALRRPLDGALREQLIHGDANAANVLIAPGLPPAIIDFAPYWRPPEFALAVTALWLCGYHQHTEAFPAFEHLRDFDQLLLRALIRTLLVMDGFGGAARLAEYAPSIDTVCERIVR
jgi:hypothetical protein